MKTSTTTETVIIILTLLPFIYLGAIYASIPDEVPMHFNASGEVDRIGSKAELWIMPFVLNAMMYFLFKYLPKLDPKNQIQKMGNKWTYLRMAMTVFMTILSCGIIFISTSGTMNFNASWIYGFTGLLFIVLGNYLPATKPNYFVGIRTPWTLENDMVWRKTHRLGGRLFMICGLLIIASTFIFSDAFTFWILIGTTIAITLITFIYSYQSFKSLSHE